MAVNRSVFLGALTALFPAAAWGFEHDGYGSCTVMHPHTTFYCGGASFLATEDDVTLGKCGASAEDRPCFSAADLSQGLECGKCYAVRYGREDDYHDPHVCQGEAGCPSFSRTVWVKVVAQGQHGRHLTPSHGAWETLCRGTCWGSEVCVKLDDFDKCVHGTLPNFQAIDGNGDLFEYTGSCSISRLDIEYEEYECPTPTPPPTEVPTEDPNQTDIVDPIVPTEDPNQTDIVDPIVPTEDPNKTDIVDPIVPTEDPNQTDIVDPIVPTEDPNQTDIVDPIVDPIVA